MIKARPKYPTDFHGTIYIDNIQKAVVIFLIIPTTFPFDAWIQSGQRTSYIRVFFYAGYSIKRKYCRND
jgi:hypothetical protein